MPRNFRSPAGLLLAALAACAGHPATAAVGPVPASRPMVYVANQASATVSVLDATTGALVNTVDLRDAGFTAKAKPHDIAVEPDGSYWYVTLVGDNYVVKFDRDNHVVGKAPMETPGLLALDTTSDMLYASRSMSAVNPPARIGAIHRSTMAIEEVDVFISRPHAIAVDSRGGYVYVGSMGQHQIAVVDTKTLEATLEDLELGGEEHEMMVQWAVSPDGTRLVGTAQMRGELVVLDSKDPMHLRQVATVKAPGWPWHVEFTPDGREVWFPNQKENAVTVVDAGTWTVKQVIHGEGLAEPHGIGISPDGNTVFVSSHNQHDVYAGQGTEKAPGTVIIIDRATGRVTGLVETSPDGAGIGVGGSR